MINVLITLLITLLSIAAAIVSWKTFDWFSWSRSREYRSSRWEYYSKKAGSSIAWFICTFLIAAAILPSAAKKNDGKNSSIPAATNIPSTTVESVRPIQPSTSQ